MKHFLFFTSIFFLMSNSTAFSQTIDGAWELKTAGKHIVLMFKDGYFTQTEFTPVEFLSAWGGSAKAANNKLIITVEFNSADSANVGKEMVYDFHMSGDKLTINKNGIKSGYKRIDNGDAPLSGVWKISARKQEGNITAIHQTGARKTLKMLTGTRFQWFAINPETKQFSGTGGGTYSFINGKYTEHIQFFSRDNKRVGAQLAFDGKLENGEWHHSGLSSKGDEIYEVWGKVK